MRVLLDSTLFTAASIPAMDLVRLFSFAAEGRHSIFPDPLDAPELKGWLANRDPVVGEECRYALNASFDLEKRREPKTQIFVTEISEPCWSDRTVLPIREAIRFLEEPLTLFVENARNDRDFIFAAADHHQRSALKACLDSSWIRFGNGGGLQEMKERFQELRSSQRRLRRTFWIFDSDALAPGFPSPPSKELAKSCERSNAFFHQLERRSAENYLPLPAIQEIWPTADSPTAKAIETRKKKARALGRLEERQRRHFNMKKGFKKDLVLIEEYRAKKKTLAIASAASELFKEIDVPTHEVLFTGLEDKIRDLFRSPHLLKQAIWFSRDDPHREIRRLIDTILHLR